MQNKPQWKAATAAGLIAGAVFLMLEMAMVAFIQGQSPWGPPRMMAAIVMGEGALPPPASFDAGIVMVAMLVHFALSIVLALIFALAHAALKMGLAAAIAAGTLFGLAVYYVDFHLFTAVFPWFAMARGTVSIVGHAVFGLTLGWSYHKIARTRLGRAEAGRVEAA